VVTTVAADDQSPRPDPRPLGLRDLVIHGGLFVATLASCWWSGGMVFAFTLMAILTAHELGHFIVARYHRLDVSLPYFIPLPKISLGTLGAVIRMGAPISKRDALIDVGAAGPLAGLVVAIPLLIIGLAHSPVGPVVGGHGNFSEGQSLLYVGLKALVFGKLLPAGQLDVNLGEMAFGAWVGLLLTFINLMPIGQLDGGHIATAAFGEKHETWARRLHYGLLAVFTGVTLALTVEGLEHHLSTLAALAHGARGGLPWLVWAGLLALMRRGLGGRYHPPVGEEALSPARRRLFWLVVVIFILIFTPVPMRETL
jgi:membrane-associated protease RseP (regulator of RpoE activity)